MKDIDILKKVVQVVSEYYDCDITQKTNRRAVTIPRQTAIYFTKIYAKGLSLSVIGQNIGNKDHSTILYSDRKVKDVLSYDKNYNIEIEEIDKRIQKVLEIDSDKKELKEKIINIIGMERERAECKADEILNLI